MASIYDEVKKAREIGGGKSDSVYSAAALKGKKEEEEGGNYGYAFGNEFVKSATGGYIGDEYEPKGTGEKVAGLAGGLAGFALPAVALGPIGKMGASALGLGLAEKAGIGATVANMFGRGATEGAIYQGLSKQKEGESRIGSAAEGALTWGALGAAGGVAEKAGKGLMDFMGNLSDVSPDTISKVMEAARRHQMTPDEIHEIIQGGTFGPGVQETADQVAKRFRPLAFELGPETAAVNDAAARKAEFLNRGKAPTPDPFAKEVRDLSEQERLLEKFPEPGTKAAEAQANRGDFSPNRGPVIDKPGPEWPQTGVSPSMLAGITHPSDLENLRAARVGPTIGGKELDFPDYERPDFEAKGSGFEPDVATKVPERPRPPLTPEQIQEEEMFGAPKYLPRPQRTLIEGNFLTPDSELTPKGAKYSGLFNFFGPTTMENRMLAAATPIPSPIDPVMEKLHPAVAAFIRDEVHGPVAAASDSFAAGNDYHRALDDGLQSAAREHRIEMSATESPEAGAEVEKGRLAMAKAAELLPKLDPNNPAADLAAKTGIPGRDAETLLMELAVNARKPIKQVSIQPWESRAYPAATNIAGEEIISPEALGRALQASEFTPEHFTNNPKLMNPDGTMTTVGKQLLRSINPEWDIPLSEKVTNLPPLPRRKSRSGKGRYYDPFDINSPEGRLGLASVRSGGAGSVPLSRATIEGLLPGTLEYGEGKGWVRKVPGGHQFTRQGAIVASRPDGFIHAIDLERNRRVERVLLDSGEFAVEGGRMGKSFAGMTEAQIAKAELDYETTKARMIELRKSVLEYGGCTPETAAVPFVEGE